MTFLLIATLKASVVIALTLIAVRGMRKQSAALRHTVLAAAIFSAAAVPLLGLITPPFVVTVDIPWGQELLRETRETPTEPAPSSTGSLDGSNQPATATEPVPASIEGANPPASNARNVALPTEPAATIAAEEPNSPPPGEASGARLPVPKAFFRDGARIDLARALGIVWLIGTIISLTPLIAGIFRLRRMERKARAVQEGIWTMVLAEAAAHYRLRRRVRLLQSAGLPVPSIWGVRRPALYIPAEADSWPEERVRVVVYHELAHVARGDWLLQMFAEGARAVYWFNPLFWVACSRLAQESEQASDDAALRSGLSEVSYANELLALARSLVSPRGNSVVSLSMAQPSTIERRFRAILDARSRRSPVTRLSGALACLSSLVLALGLVAIQLALPSVANAVAKAVPPAIAPIVQPSLTAGPETSPVAPAVELAAQEPPIPDRPFLRKHRLVVQSTGPVRFDRPKDSRDAFVSLGVQGGFQVVFHRQFETGALPDGFIVTGGDMGEALDSLSRETKSYWEVYDGNTILVGPDRSRQDFEARVVGTIHLDGSTNETKLTEAANFVREQIGAATVNAVSAPATPFTPQVVTSVAANAILFRATPEKAEAATAGKTADTVLIDFAGNTLALDGGRLRKTVALAHAELQAPGTRRISAPIQGKARDAYEKLAEQAGIRVLFHRQLANIDIPDGFSMEGADIFKALDLLSFVTGNFWQAVGPRTVVVATDNPTVRRGVEPLYIQSLRMADLTEQEHPEIVRALRTVLGSINQIAVVASGRTLILRDTADKIALAERMVTRLHRPGPERKVLFTPPNTPPISTGVFATPTDADVTRSQRAQLEVKSRGPVAITLTTPRTREAYEALAAFGGISVVFHRQFASSPVQTSVTAENVFDALDNLSLQTGNFWLVKDAHTIIVATDNPTVRREVEPMMVRTTYLRNAGREPTLVITALRTLLSFNQVAISGHANAIVMRETEDKVALAEKIIAIADVAVPGTPLAPPAASITIFPTGRFANPTDPERHATLQSQLQLKPLPLGAVELRGDSRGLFETLASRGGLRVMFDSRFVNQNEAALTLTNADLLTSLDTLSFLTGNFWQVVDPQTIKVGTDNPTVRREMEPIVTQQVDLARIAASADMTEVVAALRTILSMNPITTPPSAIVISDTADRIALAQRIIATLDIPSRRIKP